MSTSREEDVEPVVSALTGGETARAVADPIQPARDDEYRLDLADAERTGLVRELRRYGEMREDIAFGMADPGPELRFELSNDPTYYGLQSAADDVIGRAERDATQRLESELGQAAIWFDMADTVERTGQLDLTDPGTCSSVKEVLDNAGWYDPGPDNPIPDDMARIADRTRAADTVHRPRHYPSPDDSQQVAYHTGHQASQSSGTMRQPDHRVPPPVQHQGRGRAL